LNTQSATTTISHEVTVAGGVFAPGHLGELTQYLPVELAGDVLARTRAVQRRLRDLPSRAGVYFVLALGMFPQLGLPAGVGQADVRADRPEPAASVGEGAAGSAPPDRPDRQMTRDR
jgi:Insertion element 4 transposase N-terminal